MDGEADHDDRDLDPVIGQLVAGAPVVMVVARIGREPGDDRTLGAATLHFDYISPSIEEFIGSTAEEVRADPMLWRGRIHPDDRERADASRTAALAATPFFEEIEFRLRDRHGQWRWISLEMSEQPDRPGTVLGYAMDITALRAVESALRTSERRLDAFLDNAHSSIYLKDREGRYLMVNRRFLADVGLSREEVLGHTDAELFGADATTYLPHDSEVMEGGEPRIFDEEFPQADGIHFYLSSKFPLLDNAGEVEALGGLSLDITDRKRAADALAAARMEAEQARRLAEQASRGKSQFLSRMSHELRTPLNSILGFAQLLALDELSTDQRESVELIEQAGLHLLTLVNEVLDIARIESGSVSLSVEPIDLGELVQQAMELVRGSAAARGITLERSGIGWPGLIAVADKQRTLQILLNLLSNAIKYNRREGTVTVTHSRPAPGEVSIAVSDQGRGIPPDKTAALFVAFEWLGAEQSDVEGTGVGLSLSRGLAEAMGGTLELTSSSSEGSTFTVTLPGEPIGYVAEAAVDEQLAAAERTGGDGIALTVLCVEDNVANLRLVERILRHRDNTRLLTAMTGSLGLELAKANLPDLVMLDLNLPDENGDDVLRELRSDPRTADLVVAIVSADASPGKIQRLLSQGADHYLTKPIDVPGLLALLEEVAQAKGG